MLSSNSLTPEIAISTLRELPNHLRRLSTPKLLEIGEALYLAAKTAPLTRVTLIHNLPDSKPHHLAKAWRVPLATLKADKAILRHFQPPFIYPYNTYIIAAHANKVRPAEVLKVASLAPDKLREYAGDYRKDAPPRPTQVAIRLTREARLRLPTCETTIRRVICHLLRTIINPIEVIS